MLWLTVRLRAKSYPLNVAISLSVLENPCKSRKKTLKEETLKSDSHLPKIFLICFNYSLSKLMKNAFYFILKALVVLKVFKFLGF